MHFEFGKCLTGDSEKWLAVLCFSQMMAEMMFTQDESLRRTCLTHFLESYLPSAFRFFCIRQELLNRLPYVVFNSRKSPLKMVPWPPLPQKTLPNESSGSVSWRSIACGWCGIAWRHPTVDLGSVSSRVKSALCRMTVSTPPSLLLRVPCISHCSSSLPLRGVNVAFSSVTFWLFYFFFCWCFFSVAPQEKHWVFVLISFSSHRSFDQGQTKY